MSNRHTITAALALLLILALTHFQAMMMFTTRFIGGYERDAGLYIWLMLSNTRDLFGEAWFNTKAFYPYGRSLAWSDNFILPSLVAWPLLKIGLSLEIVWNLVIFGAKFLGGFLTYILARRFNEGLLAPLMAGVAFMCFGYFTIHLGHPQLQFAFWLPLFFMVLFSFFDQPKLSRAILLGLCITGCFLTTVYYAVFLSFAAAVSILLIVIARSSISTLRKLCGGLLIGGAPLLPFLPPYLDVKGTFGSRSLLETDAFSASLLSYLSSTELSSFFSFTAAWSHPETSLFPGIAVLILGLLGVFLTLKERPPQFRYLLAVLAVGLLCFGISLGKNGLLTPVYYIFPGFDSVRAIGRIGVFAIFALVLFLPTAVSKIKSFGKGGSLLAAALLVIIPLENRHWAYPIEGRIPHSTIIDSLNTQSEEDDVVMLLPLTDELKDKDGHKQWAIKSWSNFAQHNVNYMIWTNPLGVRIPNGYSGQRSAFINNYPRKLHNFPDERSLWALRTIGGLKYVVYMASRDPRYDERAFLQKLEAFRPHLELIDQDLQRNYLFRFNPGPFELTQPDKFRLMVPSFPTGRLSLSIERVGTGRAKLDLFLEKHFEDSPFDTIQLEDKDGVQSFVVPLPTTSDRVRPLTVRFKADSSQARVMFLESEFLEK